MLKSFVVLFNHSSDLRTYASSGWRRCICFGEGLQTKDIQIEGSLWEVGIFYVPSLQFLDGYHCNHKLHDNARLTGPICFLPK